MLRIIFGPMRDEKRGLTCLGEISVLSECTKIPVGPKWLYWRNERRALGEWVEWTYWIKYIDTLNWRHWQTELSVLAECTGEMRGGRWENELNGRTGLSISTHWTEGIDRQNWVC